VKWGHRGDYKGEKKKGERLRKEAGKRQNTMQKKKYIMI
jgi:hypothetical protein